MKYAKEVIGLLAAHPDKRFRMAHIVRYVTQGAELSTAQRQAVRVGVRRVINELIDTGQVVQIKTSPTTALYTWPHKLIHEVRANCYVT